MIKTEEGRRLALAQLTWAYEAIATLRKEHPTASPRWLELLAEGFVAHAEQLRREIEDYTGLFPAREAEAKLSRQTQQKPPELSRGE